MADLNIVSNCIVFVFECTVKSDPQEFQKWIKNRASKYVYELKETKITSRSHADEISKKFIPNEAERNFILKNLKRKGDYFGWAPNINLLLNSISSISFFLFI